MVSLLYTYFNPLTPKISFGNSPYCLSYSSCDVSLELVLIPLLIFLFILINYLLDIVLIL